MNANAAVRLGLLGAGPWGRNYIRTVADRPGVILARIASRNPETRSLVTPGTSVVPDWREVAAADDIDGVIVATPPALHAEMATAAIRAGKSVLIEKPLTLDVREARALLAESDTTACTVMVNHIHLFHPAYRQLKRLAAELGPIRSIEGVAGQWGPFRPDTPVLWDWGVHDVAMCLDLVGMPMSAISVVRAARRGAGDGPGEEVSIRLQFAGGPHASIAVGNCRRNKTRLLTVEFDEGELVYDGIDSGGLYRTIRGEDATRAIPISGRLPLDVAIDEFADAIRRGTADRSGVRLGVETVDVLTRCQQVMT